jgi:UPF0755 protein
VLARRLNLIALGLALMLVSVALGAFHYFAWTDRAYPAAAQTVVIPSGATGHDIGELLQSRGIIRSALVFALLARIDDERTAMKAGEFAFAAHRSESEILKQVVTDGEQVALWVTIPEGFTAKEIAQTLAERDLGDVAALQSTFLDTPLEIAGSKAPTLEGYLFPDTYLVPTSATPAEIAKIMTDQFRAELPSDAALQAKRLGFTIPQIVTLASLVEREAKSDDERALMAGVYYNRLRRGMPLQVDASLEYTFAHHKDVITYADLARDTPYNTYEHTGLPPTPIANPGRASLLAAFHPRASKYLYYVSMGNGHHAFSRTLAEHNANVARYLH